MQIENFITARPYLYHLTAQSNLKRIVSTRSLESTARLAQAAARPDLLRVRRKAHELLELDGERVTIRDQAPLHRGNMQLTDGWTYEDFIAYLNQRVFFWPGTAKGPIAYGMRHFERYRAEQPTILRVSTNSLVASNASALLTFSTCNSGSPRYNGGNPAKRGPNTFIPTDGAAFTPGRVVEVTVEGSVALPPDTEYGNSDGERWTLLFTEHE